MAHDEYEDFQTFLRKAGFEGDEVLDVVYELQSYRTIPGTTLRKYINRVLATIEEEQRRAFLKGIIVGTALHKHMETLDLEEHINSEVARRLKEILSELNPDQKNEPKP